MLVLPILFYKISILYFVFLKKTFYVLFKCLDLKGQKIGYIVNLVDIPYICLPFEYSTVRCIPYLLIVLYILLFDIIFNIGYM